MVFPKLVWRYLFSGKFSTRLVTAVSLFGTFIATVSLLLTLGVMNGFQRAVSGQILSKTPHVLVICNSLGEAKEILAFARQKFPGLKEEFWYANFNLIAQKGRNLSPLTIFASDIENLERFFNLKKNLLIGKVDKKSLILGELVADNLNIVLVPSKILLINPIGKITPIGFMPQMEEFPVSGIYSTGIYIYDTAAVADYNLLSKLFKPTSFNVVLQLKDPYRVSDVKKTLAAYFPSVYISTWVDRNRDFFAALELEKRAMIAVVALIAVVAVFNVFSLLLMKIRELRKDFAVMRAFGIGAGYIFALVLAQGFLIGLLGALFGAAVAAAAAKVLTHYRLIGVPADVYLVSYIPIEISPLNYVLTVSGIVLLATISATFPARMAVKEKVSQILRNE